MMIDASALRTAGQTPGAERCLRLSRGSACRRQVVLRKSSQGYDPVHSIVPSSSYPGRGQTVRELQRVHRKNVMHVVHETCVIPGGTCIN